MPEFKWFCRAVSVIMRLQFVQQIIIAYSFAGSVGVETPYLHTCLDMGCLNLSAAGMKTWKFRSKNHEAVALVIFYFMKTGGVMDTLVMQLQAHCECECDLCIRIRPSALPNMGWIKTGVGMACMYTASQVCTLCVEIYAASILS